jgi:hypothetical protein
MPIIKAIDPDELPQITYAISLKNTNDKLQLTNQERYIYLRQIANIIKNEFKVIPNVTTLDIIG